MGQVLSDQPVSSRAGAVAALICVLTVTLGGATARWGQGIALVGIGVLVLSYRPRIRPPRWQILSLGLLTAITAAAWLPASWFPSPAWRLRLVELGVSLPSTISPQPLLSLDSAPLLLGAGLWWLWLCSRGWRSSERWFAIQAFTLCGTLFAIAALIFAYTGSNPAFWAAPHGFGPFPNRNQTGNFLGLCSIMALACTQHAWQRRHAGWVGWLIAWGVLLAAVVENGSRAGVGIVFGGAVAWLAVLGIFQFSARRLVIGGSVICIALSLFFLFGGRTLDRFENEFSLGDDGVRGVRALIAREATVMARDTPWCGVGFGSFQPLFPFYRTETRGPMHMLHPESDWLWLWVEGGWASLAVVALAFGGVVWASFPLDEGSDRRLRSAALVAGIAFAIHGLVDVSGHRLGSMLPALFLLSLAPRPARTALAGMASVAAFRAAGAGLIFLGALWLVEATRGPLLPDTSLVSRAKADAAQFGQLGRSDESLRRLGPALQVAPLDWELYFHRGAARAVTGQLVSAVADFRIVRQLQPFLVSIPLAEARLWLTVQPALALDAWREALRRAAADGTAAGVYGQILSDASKLPALRPSIHALAQGDPRLELIYLNGFAPPEEAVSVISAILAADPELAKFDDAGKEQIFNAWARHGDADALENAFADHLDWRRAGWRIRAQRAATQGAFEEACRIAFDQLPGPVLPNFTSAPLPIVELQRRVLLNPADFASSYNLYLRHTQRGDPEFALSVLRRANAQPGAPAYFRYLEARLRRDRGEWGEAWRAVAPLIDSAK